MTASNTMAKRAAAGTLALAVCLTGGLVSAGAANAAAGFTFNTRIAGEDRYLTSVEASKAAFPTGASSVVITNGLSEVDGLTASYVAGLHSAPILYTSGPSTISAAVQAEITRLKPTTVYIVGGETVVTKTVEDALKATTGVTTVTRYGGSDRYETAAKVATSGTVKPGKVIVASGVSFADALVAGPVAYKQKYPILLTAATGVPSYTEAALKTLAVDTVNVVGGTTVVTDATYAAVGGDKRLAGETRQETAIKVADDAIANEGFSSTSVALVGNTNANAADALVAAPLAGKNAVPLLFIDNNGTAKPTITYLTANSARLTGTGYVFGGTTAVPAAAVTAAQTAATSTAPSLGSIAFSPTAATTVALANESSPTDSVKNADNRLYTATGLTAGEVYRVTLVNTSSIVVDASGNVTFLSSTDSTSPSGFSVNPGTDVADIVAVNNGTPTFASGTPSTEKRSTTTTPVNGSITVEVDGDLVGSVTPVIYLDGGTGQTVAQGGTSQRLETVATTAGAFAAPSEAFGLGGAIAFTPVAAPTSATAADYRLVSLNKDANTFSTIASSTAGYSDPSEATLQFAYDANDTFTVGGSAGGGTTAGPTDLAGFEAAIARGAIVTVSSYSPTVGAVSSFTLKTAVPVAPTLGVANGTNNTVLTVTPNTVTDASLYSYVVQRAAGTGATTGFATVASPAASVDEDTATTTFTYTDANLAAGTYTYRVAVVLDGVQSPYSASQNGTSSAATADTTAPVPTYAAVITDAGLGSVGDSGDVLRFIATEPVTTATGATIRVSEGATGPETFDLVSGGNATFALNTTATAIGSTNYAAGRILTVTLTAKPTPIATVTSGDNNLNWAPTTTVTNSAGIADAAGNRLALVGANGVTADIALNLDTNAPTLGAAVTSGGNTITLTPTPAAPISVVNNSASRAQFAYVVNPATPTATLTPESVTVNAGGELVLVFAAGVVTGGATDVLTYTPSSTTSANVVGLNGRAVAAFTKDGA